MTKTIVGSGGEIKFLIKMEHTKKIIKIIIATLILYIIFWIGFYVGKVQSPDAYMMKSINETQEAYINCMDKLNK